jgi:hypothetical protein
MGSTRQLFGGKPPMAFTGKLEAWRLVLAKWNAG